MHYKGGLITHKKLLASFFMKHDISMAQPIKELHEKTEMIYCMESIKTKVTMVNHISAYPRSSE